jgi:Na+/H+-translocating membrane pyrophosphatase
MGNRRFQRGDQYAFLAIRVVVLALLLGLAFSASGPVGHILGAVGSVLWAIATAWAFKNERRRAAALPESPTV